MAPSSPTVGSFKAAVMLPHVTFGSVRFSSTDNHIFKARSKVILVFGLNALQLSQSEIQLNPFSSTCGGHPKVPTNNFQMFSGQMTCMRNKIGMNMSYI